MPDLNRRRCTHCHRWPSCWLHRSCIRKFRCRGCPGWASTQDAAWRRYNTGRALGSTLTVITPYLWDKLHGCPQLAPKYWPVQIIHGCARASVSTVAAIVSVVEDGPAVRLHTQDHLPELVEGQVVQRLTWKHGKKSSWSPKHAHLLRDLSRFWDVPLTDGEACSHEEHDLECIHPGEC